MPGTVFQQPPGVGVIEHCVFLGRHVHDGYIYMLVTEEAVYGVEGKNIFLLQIREQDSMFYVVDIA